LTLAPPALAAQFGAKSALSNPVLINHTSEDELNSLLFLLEFVHFLHELSKGRPDAEKSLKLGKIDRLGIRSARFRRMSAKHLSEFLTKSISSLATECRSSE
jgi:hypothetical protein